MNVSQNLRKKSTFTSHIIQNCNFPFGVVNRHNQLTCVDHRSRLTSRTIKRRKRVVLSKRQNPPKTFRAGREASLH
ncbi:hypothetical protein Hanom_Chr06g00492061 [Helianthus anomalus]